ncbi:MAG: MarR family transcriptional regulator [Proteobacteria bacterium]|nr:MarR family transcriptional regulator [Pseudomonadota bacterium]
MPSPEPKSEPKAANRPDVSDLLCFAIYSTGHAFNRVYKPLLDALGLTYPQYLVMVALWAENDQTVGQLGDRLFLESSTLTPLLKRLEALGFLTRKRDPEDERQVRLRLTDKGANLRKKARDVGGCIIEAVGLSGEAAVKLRGDIVRLRDNLMKAAG